MPRPTTGQKLSRRQDGGATFYIATELARLIPDEQRFVAELTEEGVLFRRLPEVETTPKPSWAAAAS